MKVLLATSALTFVPQNYDGFVRPLLGSGLIGGLLVEDNRRADYLAKAAVLGLTVAPRFGVQLFRNFFGNSLAERRSLCEELGLPFMVSRNFNDPTCRGWIAENGFDLILNARTRTFFRRPLLALPRLGCINVHHGLLPEQRGLMCDFWSHLEELPAGFSIHVMTPKLDDGRVLVRREHPRQGNYLEFIAEGSRLEAEACLELLSRIGEHREVPPGLSETNTAPVYRRNPGWGDFRRLRRKGVRL